MNLRALVDVFRIKAQDNVRPYLWPDDELAQLFSDAEQEAAIRARLITDRAEISIAAGEASIDLPKCLFDIQYAELRSADGTAREIKGTDRVTLDASRPGWRTKAEPPTGYIHDDRTLTLSAIPDVDYTLYLEFFRGPAARLENDGDEPEIAEQHHMALLDWVLFRAYEKPDADTMNPGKSADGEARFTAYFGPRPNADLRRRQNANRPHRNRLHM